MTTFVESHLDADTPRLLGRQPILDQKESLFAYELLFRGSSDNAANVFDGEAATDHVIDQAINLAGFDQLSNGKKIFINLTREGLLSERYQLLAADQVVIELLEDVEPDAPVVQACETLRDKGYQLALDDVVDLHVIAPLLPLANIVKVDFSLTTKDQQREIAQILKGRKIQSLAEKIETREVFDEALKCGYDLFQGYFFQKPQIVARADVSAALVVYLQFIDAVNRPTMDFDAIERIMKSDLALSVKLLRYLNSGRFNLSEKVTSIKQALVLLGERPLKRWATVVGIACLSSGRPQQLVVDSLLRAHFTEAIAPLVGLKERSHDLFVMGLLSLIDVLIGQPLDEVLIDMAVPLDVRIALMGSQKSLLGKVFTLTQVVERHDVEGIQQMAEQLKLTSQQVTTIYADAVVWADDIFSFLDTGSGI